VIRDDDVYPGVRASLEARLATARLKFSVDFNVGDPVIPAPIRTGVPVLLGGEPIEVLAYPKVMVVAEKLVTALQRGRASTRWRDFADPAEAHSPRSAALMRASASSHGTMSSSPRSRRSRCSTATRFHASRRSSVMGSIRSRSASLS
jgi:hypothetical protein